MRSPSEFLDVMADTVLLNVAQYLLSPPCLPGCNTCVLPLIAPSPRRYAAYMELFDPLCGPAGPSRPLMVGEGAEGTKVRMQHVPGGGGCNNLWWC